MNVDVRRDGDAHAWRCWLDGREVTRDCFAADDGAGWVDLYLADALGRVWYDRLRGGPIEYRTFGDVYLEGPGYRTPVYHDRAGEDTF